MASPIFYPASPTDMGGGAAAGGGADLSALGFTQIDLTDGFTLTDPDSLVDSVSYTGGVNKVVLNALASGDTNHTWGLGNTQRAPRWVKDLDVTDATGGAVQPLSGDTFILQTVLQFATPDNRYAAEIVVASSVDGTGLDSFTNDAQGGVMRYNTTGNVAYGVFTFNGQTSLGTGAPDHSTCTVLHSGARGQGGVYVNLDGSGVVVNGGSRNGNMDYSDGTTGMKLMVGVGKRDSLASITAGDDAQFQAWYRVVRFTLPI